MSLFRRQTFVTQRGEFSDRGKQRSAEEAAHLVCRIQEEFLGRADFQVKTEKKEAIYQRVKFGGTGDM